MTHNNNNNNNNFGTRALCATAQPARAVLYPGETCSTAADAAAARAPLSCTHNIIRRLSPSLFTIL